MNLTKENCHVCDCGTGPMEQAEEEKYAAETPKWFIDREGIHLIRREFTFKNFLESMDFVHEVADLAEAQGHHPNIFIYYNRVILELYSRKVNGLHDNDFILATKIDLIQK